MTRVVEAIEVDAPVKVANDHWTQPESRRATGRYS